MLAEESDVNSQGEVQSHYAMYLDAMGDMKVNTDEISSFVKVDKLFEVAVSQDFLTIVFLHESNPFFRPLINWLKWFW